MTQLVVTSYGDPREVVSLEHAPRLSLDADDVLVEMEAAPVNPSDFLLIRGVYGIRPSLPSPVGGEGVGRVVDAGGAAGAPLVGRKVIVRREAAARIVRDAGADRVIVAGDDLPARRRRPRPCAQAPGAIVTDAFVTDEPPAVPAHELIFKEVTHTGLWMYNWLRYAPRAEIEQTYGTLADLVATGVLDVPVEATYRLDDHRAAFEHEMRPGRTGKILFTFAQA
jgi:NADPH:quinone reductase-like Zn-dependent oxidoreductase